MSFVATGYAALADSVVEEAQRRERMQAEAQNQQLTRAYVQAQYHKLDLDLAASLAIRGAVQEVLSRLVTDAQGRRPPIALLDDQFLRDRIANAGKVAYEMAGPGNSGFDAAKEAGRTFKIPEIPDLFHNHIPVHLYNERTELANQRGLKIQELRKEKDLLAAELTACKQQIDVLLRGIELNAEELKKAKEASAKDPQEATELKALRTEVEKLTKFCVQHMAQAAAFRTQLTEVDPENPLVRDSILRQRVAEVAYDQFMATGGQDWALVRQVGASFVSTAERDRSHEPPRN